MQVTKALKKAKKKQAQEAKNSDESESDVMSSKEPVLTESEIDKLSSSLKDLTSEAKSLGIG